MLTIRIGRMAKTVLYVLLPIGAIFCLGYPWLSSEIAIRRALSVPRGALSGSDEATICKYVQGTWTSRPMWVGISEERQGGIADLAVQQAVACGEPVILLAVTEQWYRQGLFRQLPQYVAKAVVEGAPNCDSLLGTVGCEKGRIDPYIDVPFVMERSRDERVIASCCVVLTWETLDLNRTACLRMLNRKDIGGMPKMVLRERIGGAGAQRAWFGHEEGTGPSSDK